MSETVAYGTLTSRRAWPLSEFATINHLSHDPQSVRVGAIEELLDQWHNALNPTPASQMAAAWILENPAVVYGKAFLEIAGGSGIVTISAAKAGARQAKMIDLRGAEIASRNAALNNVADKVSVTEGDIFSPSNQHLFAEADVIALCAFFTHDHADISDLLLEEAKKGKTVIVSADPCSDMGWEKIAKYSKPIAPNNLADMQARRGIVMYKLG